MSPRWPPIEPSNLNVEERRKVLVHFNASLWELRDMDVYWLPSKRGIACRRVKFARWNWRAPDGAIFYGRFSHPFSSRTFVTELDKWLGEMESK